MLLSAVQLVLNCTYAAQSSVFYDLGCKFISPKFSGCKSCFKAKEKAVRPKRGLLVGVAIFCLVDIGEGRLFDVANEAIDNIHLEEVGMKVRQFNVVVRHYPPYKSSTSFPPCIFRLTELTDRSFLYLFLLLEE